MCVWKLLKYKVSPQKIKQNKKYQSDCWTKNMFGDWKQGDQVTKLDNDLRQSDFVELVKIGQILNVLERQINRTWWCGVWEKECSQGSVVWKWKNVVAVYWIGKSTRGEGAEWSLGDGGLTWLLDSHIGSWQCETLLSQGDQILCCLSDQH